MKYRPTCKTKKILEEHRRKILLPWVLVVLVVYQKKKTQKNHFKKVDILDFIKIKKVCT